MNPEHYNIDTLNVFLCSKFPDTVQHAIEFTKEIRLCNGQECDDLTRDNTGGLFQFGSKEIIINKNTLTGIISLAETILHELTHALQSYENGYFNMPNLESIEQCVNSFKKKKDIYFEKIAMYNDGSRSENTMHIEKHANMMGYALLEGFDEKSMRNNPDCRLYMLEMEKIFGEMEEALKILKQVKQDQEKQVKLEIQSVRPTKEESEYYKVNQYQKDSKRAQIEETCNIKDMWQQQTPKHNNNHKKGRGV